MILIAISNHLYQAIPGLKVIQTNTDGVLVYAKRADKDKIQGIKEIKLVETNEDKTKKYMITGEKDEDLRKVIFTEFAKEGITIFEMKKPEATLEDAFMKIIGEGGNK